MTTPLWCLLGFVVWTMVLLAGIGGARVAQVLRGEKQPNEFPSGVPHGVNVRFTFFLVQLGCLVGFLLTIRNAG